MDKKRNYGIDLLRIVAMFMIVILHILGAGGIIYTIDSSSPIYVLSWGMEFAAYCAVNCYALISGYVGIDSKFKFSNIFHLWIQVTLTTVVITMIFGLTGNEVHLYQILQAFTPVTSQLYWYFTAYVCMYFLVPFLNLLLKNLDKKMAGYLMVVLGTLFSVIPTLFQTDLFLINFGYSAAWLIVLYLAGGIINKFYSNIKFKKRFLLGGYLLAVGLTLGSKLGVEYITSKTTFDLLGSNFLMNYNSPTIILAGICLLLLFSNLKIERGAKVIALMAPCTFGVYIIHSHPMVWDNIIVNGFVKFTSFSPYAFVFVVFLVAIIIYVSCTAIEFVRIKIFQALHVMRLCKWIESKGQKILERLWKDDKENIV